NDGNAALQQGNYAEARRKYQEALPLLEPVNQVAVMRAIAGAYYRESTQTKTKEEKAHKTDQALAALKEGLAIKGDDVESLQLIVSLLVISGREADAETFMARLPPGAKVDPDILLNIGIKYYNEENTSEALKLFGRVVSESPNLAQAYYYRARAYLNKGLVPEAKADLQKLLAIDPNNKFSKEAQEYLESETRITKEAGRRYTAWFYAGGIGLDKISEQCSPSMRKAVGGASGLLAFRHGVMSADGTENSVLSERVQTIGDQQVYTRLTKFSRTARAVEVQWTIGHDGSIEGFYVRIKER
ncbi:MAG TPA: tetratricopeptide repeat protein, partial [Thermoanaerobaculia bacterium]